MMTPFTSFALDTMIWTGALAVLVMALRGPVARWFGPGLAYALWLLPLARLFLPPLLLPSWLSFKEFAPVASQPVPGAAGADTVLTIHAAPLEAGPALPWDLLLVSAWLGGAALFLLFRWRDYRAMRRALLAQAVEVDCREGVRLVETPAVSAPVAFGLRDKVIALPPRFLISGNLRERALAIEHELAHHRGRDLHANWLAQPLLALHWFNPLAWAAWNAMRRDQEAACDARALAGSDPATRAAYARVIASFAVGDRLRPSIALAAPMVLGDKSIIHRLRSLTMTEISPRRRRAGRWALAAGAALALPLTATVVYAGRDEAAATPVAPAAPTAPEAPAAPAAPETPKVKKIMIVEHAGDGEHGDQAGADGKKLFERRIERDGKTVIIRSHKPIEDVEIETHIGKLGELDLPGELLGAEAGGKPGEKRTMRRIMVHDGELEIDGHKHPAMAMVMGRCDKDKTIADADASHEEAGVDGKKVHRTRIVMCGRPGENKAQALSAVRKARERIAGRSDMPEGVREKVLKQLDEAIAGLEKDAG